MTAEDDKKRLLGLSGSAEDSIGQEIRVRDRVWIEGKILRIHASGFMIVEIEGGNSQPAILVHSRNTNKIIGNDGKNAGSEEKS